MTEVVFSIGISPQTYTRISRKEPWEEILVSWGMQLNPPSMKGFSYIYFPASSGSKQPLSFQGLLPWKSVAYPIPVVTQIFHLGPEWVQAIDALSPRLEGKGQMSGHQTNQCKQVDNLCVYSGNQSNIPARCRNQSDNYTHCSSWCANFGRDPQDPET